MRLIGYTRVSMRKQAEEGHSLDAQEGLLRRWASQYDHDLITVIPDVMSSRRTDKLHGRHAAIRLIESGWAEGLLILRWDRATRSTLDGAQLLEQATVKGWPILSTTGGDSNDESRAFMTDVEIAYAAEERRRISRRTKEGLVVARAKGHHPGRPAADLPTVTLHMIGDLNDQGLSARGIARTLNERSIPTPTGEGGWAHTTVTRVIRRLDAEAS